MEKNLYWVQLKMLRDAQDPGRGKRTGDHYISATFSTLENEIEKAKRMYCGEVQVANIVKL